MKKQVQIVVLCSAAMVFIGSMAHGANIDLRNWTQEGPPGNGNWTVAADGSNVFQTTNGQPTYYVSDKDYINTKFEGSFGVETTSDDDFIGFVFGWADDEDYYLFDWKQNAQTSSGYANEGFTLSKISGTNVNFWNHTGSDISVIDTNYGSDKGWADNTPYDFTLDFSDTMIDIKIDGVTVLSASGSYTTGKFGFYNYSQSRVRYQGFEETVLPPPPPADVPEPATLLLFGTGVAGLCAYSRRKKRV